MTQIRLDQAPVDGAAELLHERFGSRGWGGAAAMYTARVGICQERLRFWGPHVEVAVPAEEHPGWQPMSLNLLQPFWWGTQFGSP